MSDPDPSFAPPVIINKRDAVAYVSPMRHRQARGDGDELTLDFRQILQMWLRRWKPAVALGLLAAVMAAVVGLHARPVYTATSMIVIEQGQHDIVHLGATPEEMPTTDASAVDTKVMMASSQAVAERVVETEHLLQDPEYVGPPSKEGKPPPTVAQVAVALRRHLIVRRSGMTSGIQLQFQSHEAVKAARIANAFADEFINWEIDSKVNSNQRSNQFINDHLNSLQREAEAAETQVEQYKIAHNLMSSAGQTIAEQQVGTLSTQIAAAQAELAEKDARLGAANDQSSRGGGNEDTSAALTSNTIAQLRTQQAETSRALAELKAHYGPRYPDVLKAESQLKDINGQIQGEANRIKSSISADASAAAQRLRSLRSSQESAQGSLAANSRAEVGLIELERRAEASRQLYDAFLNRSKETNVQGAEQPDARVFDRATVPSSPSSPNPRVIAISVVVVAIAVGALVIAVLEIMDTSMRSSDDVMNRFELPVVGIIPTPTSSERKFRRLAKLPPQEYLMKKPFSVFAEAFRNVRASLILPDEYGRKNKVIAVASSLPKEGKSTSVFCLMRTIAMSGTSVVLVDCDLRRRGVSAFVTPVEGKGLVEVLEGKADVSDALVFDTVSSGWVLPVTDAQGGQVDLFSSLEMDKLLEELRQRFDVILLDTPAALAVADARILAVKADAVLFLAQWAKTPAKAIELGLETLSGVGANIIGVILSRVDLKRQLRTSYGDGASYYREYEGYYQN